MPNHRPKPPPTLDSLRAQLDQAAVSRVLLPLDQPVHRPEDLAATLHMSVTLIAVPILVDADGDRLTAIIPGGSRLDLYKLAAAVGARQVRLHGTGKSRRQAHSEEPQLITGLPTVLDRSLMRLDYLFSFTGDPQWAIRIGPIELRRATAGQLADIARPSRVSGTNSAAPAAASVDSADGRD